MTLLITAALGSRIQEIRHLGYSVLPKPIDLDHLEKQILDACRKFQLALRD